MELASPELTAQSRRYLKQIRFCAILFGVYWCHDVLFSAYNIFRSTAVAGGIGATWATVTGGAYILVAGFIAFLSFWHALVLHEVLAGRRPFVAFVRDHVRFIQWTLLSMPLGLLLLIVIGIAVGVATAAPR